MSSQKSTFVITFTRDAVALETLSFDRKNVASLDVLTAASTFVSGSRTRNGQIPILANTGINGEAEAIGYEKYFNIDHNQAGLMTITRAAEVITISININWELEQYSTDTGATLGTIARGPQTFQLTRADLQVHPTTPCDKINVEIHTSVPATGYSYALGNAPIIPIYNANPFNVPIDRVIPTNIWIHKPGSDSINVVDEAFGEPYIYVNKIFTENVTFAIVTSVLSGATVTVNATYPGQLTQRPLPLSTTYSLDDVTYQSSNIFTGQVDGDYTIYIKDNLGCTFQKDFEVLTGSSGRSSFIRIPNVNSVTFSQDQIWDGLENGIHKNNDNVLALTGSQMFLYDERLIYREEDLVTIQFKSNYDYHAVSIQNSEGDAISLVPVVEKKSQNLNLFESLSEAKLFSYGNGVSAIYYVDGSVYNEAGAIIDTCELNGNLPDSAYIGNKVEISGGVGIHEIVNIVYDEDKDKMLLIFNFSTSTTTAFDVVTRAYYDLLPYEIYEFDLDFSQVVIHGGLANEVRVRLQATDDLYDEVNFYSEYITILEDFTGGLDKYVALNYWNDNNRDIFYTYGITHFFRAEILKSNALIEDSAEIIKGDNATYMSESNVSTGISISFSEVTYRVMLKIVLALSSESLFVNGIGYVKKDSVSVKPIENTNLYSIDCDLLSSGESFSTVIDIKTGRKEDYKTIYIPKLLGTGTKYLKS